MTSLYAVTSWSWRLVTISQVSFHLLWLDIILQLSNMYVNLINYHVKIEGMLVLLQFRTTVWRHIVTSWRDVVTCWRQLTKSVSMICLIPTTQISIEFVWESHYGSTTRSVCAVGWWQVLTWRHDVTSWRKNIDKIKNHSNFWTQWPEKPWKQKKNQLSSSYTSWDR